MPTAAEAILENAQFNARNASYDAGSAAAMFALQQSNPALYSQVMNAEAQRDVASEAAKYQAAFSQPRVDLGRTPAVIAGEAAYAQQRGLSVGGSGSYQQSVVSPSATNPYNPNSAAGIAWDIAKSGGVVNPYLAKTSATEGYTPTNISQYSGRETVPIRDLSSGMGTSPVFGGQGSTVTAYVPYGNYAQQELRNAKLAMGFNTGEIGIYQQPTGHSIYNLVGGGGRNALQSGMFTINEPETPFVVRQGDIGKYVLPSGAGLSRLGAEAYGGFVSPLDNRTLTPTSLFSQYPGNVNNLANYVNPQGPNLGKGAAPGANIPWSVGEGSPALQYMDETGIIQRNVSPIGIPLAGGGGGVVTGTETASKTPQIETQTILRPSDFDLWAMSNNIPFAGTLIGASDFLFGGRSIETIQKSTSISPDITTMGSPVTTTRNVEGGVETTTITPYSIEGGKTTNVVSTRTPLESGFDIGQKSFVSQVVSPIVPTLSLPRTGTPADYPIALVEGGYGAIREKPLTAAVNVGVGALLALGGEAIAGLGAATILATEGSVLAPIATAATFAATKAAPAILTGLYIGDVAGRSTEWGTDLSTKSATRLGGIISTESLPMLAGGLAVAYRGNIAREISSLGTTESQRFTYKTSQTEVQPPSPGITESVQNRINNLREGTSELMYKYQQRSSGITNIGRESGLEFYREPTSYQATQPRIKEGIPAYEPTATINPEQRLLPSSTTVPTVETFAYGRRSPVTFNQAPSIYEAPQLKRAIVPKDATELQRVQASLKINPPGQVLSAMEYITGRYPKQTTIASSYLTDIQMAPRGSLRQEIQMEPLAESSTTELGYREPMNLNIPSYAETRPVVNLLTGEVISARGIPVMSAMERSMVISQYDLTPSEITTARMQGLTLNEILATRTAEPITILQMQQATQPQRETAYERMTTPYELTSISARTTTRPISETMLVSGMLTATTPATSTAQRISEKTLTTFRLSTLSATDILTGVKTETTTKPKTETILTTLPFGSPQPETRMTTKPETSTKFGTYTDTFKTTIPPIPPGIPPFGRLPASGGGGRGHYPRRKRKVELFSFEIGQDTPIPTRYGLAGQTTQYISGTRGIAKDILSSSDIAPNPLFNLGRRTPEDRL